jgi:hypothetical protein
MDVLKKGVTGWKNYKQKGKEVKYVDEKSLGVLPIRLQLELRLAIENHAILTDEELQGLEL